jgi:hypothetical protein
MWLRRRLSPKPPQVLFRTVESDPLIRDAVTVGPHIIRSHMKFILQPWQLLLLASWINHREQKVIEYLRAENRVLREDGKRRILLDDGQRRCPAIKGKILCRKMLERWP